MSGPPPELFTHLLTEPHSDTPARTGDEEYTLVDTVELTAGIAQGCAGPVHLIVGH